MDLHETIGVQRATHVVDVGLASPIDPREVGASEDVEGPGELVLGILLQECLVCDGGRVVGGVVRSGKSDCVNWRRFVDATLFILCAERDVVFGWERG